MRVCVAGTGFFSQFHYEAWRRLGVNVVGVCSLDQVTAQARADDFPNCRAFDDFPRMLDEMAPDLVDIVTPPPTHLGFVSETMRRRISTICQKPFTGTLEDARTAAGLAEAAGVTLVVHENFRFQPWYREIRRQLLKGTVGELYQITFRLRPGDGQGPDAYLGRQPYFQKMPKFLIHETAIHLIDVFRYLGGEVETVTAELARLNPVIAGEDAAMVAFRLNGGARALFDGNRLADHAAKNRRLVMGEMWVEGSGGTLRLDGDGGLWYRPMGGNDETAIAYAWEDRGYGGDCVHALQAHVLDCLQNGTMPENTAAAYLRNMEIEAAVYRSDAEGRRIGLSL